MIFCSVMQGFARRSWGTGMAWLAGAGPLSVLSLALVGCSSTKTPLMLQPIGPDPHSTAPDAGHGSLVVFSAFEPTPDWNRSPYRRRYTDYWLYTADGEHLVQVVHNNRETLVNSPPPVELAPGSYRVVARANGYGSVTVPVVIKPAQLTTVHLEGSVWWPRSSPIFESDPVRLPKGEIAGWRADAGTP